MGGRLNVVQKELRKQLSNEFKAKYLERFSKEELYFLQKIFLDLADKQEGMNIEKKTFLEFFKLPGIWGEQLYKQFDLTKTNTISFEEFLTGIALCCKGSEEEIINYLFKIYDFASDGFINRSDLATMLHSVEEDAFGFTVPNFNKKDSQNSNGVEIQDIQAEKLEINEIQLEKKIDRSKLQHTSNPKSTIQKLLSKKFKNEVNDQLQNQGIRKQKFCSYQQVD